MAMKIGCDHLVYSIMQAEGDRKTPPTWGEVQDAPGVMAININPNAGQETAFFDDGPGDTATSLGAIEVEIEKNQLTTVNKADLLGHLIDEKGGLVFGGQDTPPWVAIGFRTLRSNGKYRYVWLYKGKFMEPEDNNETKGDTIDFQSETITGNFVKIDYMLKAKGKDGSTKEVQPWKYEADEENEDTEELINKWFDKVLLPATGSEV